MSDVSLSALTSWLRAVARRLGEVLRRNAHRVQAFLAFVGIVAYNVVAGVGIDTAMHWSRKEWVGHLLYAFGLPLLFLLRGKHVPAPPLPEPPADPGEK